MDMVCHAAHSVQSALPPVDDAPNVFVAFFYMGFRKCGFPVFRTNDNLLKDLPAGAHNNWPAPCNTALAACSPW